MSIVDRHDDHVRELFHLDRFVTLLGFDPSVAKGRSSFCYLAYLTPLTTCYNVLHSG